MPQPQQSGRLALTDMLATSPELAGGLIQREENPSLSTTTTDSRNTTEVKDKEDGMLASAITAISDNVDISSQSLPLGVMFLLAALVLGIYAARQRVDAEPLLAETNILADEEIIGSTKVDEEKIFDIDKIKSKK